MNMIFFMFLYDNICIMFLLRMIKWFILYLFLICCKYVLCLNIWFVFFFVVMEYDVMEEVL